MGAEGSCIDFMFLGRPLPGRWIQYCLDGDASLFSLRKVVANKYNVMSGYHADTPIATKAKHTC